MRFIRNIACLWSTTDFNTGKLTQYAERYIEDEVRNGILTLAVVSLLLLGTAAILYTLLGFNVNYIYTFSMLAVLALHIAVSSQYIKTTSMLYMLGITLLVIAGSAFVLLAHKTGSFSAAILSSTALLFMLVPLASWGLREATIVVFLIYLEFSLSTINAYDRFDPQTLWLLQFLMLGSALTTLTIVARSVSIRKRNIQTHFELEAAHKETKLLSFEDPLTGALNRRFLDLEFLNIVTGYQDKNEDFYFAVIDVDKFKEMNDTHGHIFGDCALQHLAKLLLVPINNNGYLFRLGGDEFALLFQCKNPEEIINNAVDKLHLIPDSFGNINQLIKMSISVGLIRVKPKQPVTLDLLYSQADRALYAAKVKSKITPEQSHIVLRPFLFSNAASVN